MVFDWFKRGAVPQDSPAAAADSPPEPLVDPASESPPEPSAQPQAASSPKPSPALQAPAAPAPPSPGPAAVDSSGVDQDALEWARQAYARLKAQQEAARQAEQQGQASSGPPATTASHGPPAAAVAPVEPPPALETVPPQEAQPSPEVSPSPELPAEAASVSAAAPVGENPPPPPQPLAGLSLLEQAAAEREQRRQQLLAEEPAAPEAPVAAAAVTGQPPAPPALGSDGEPTLGEFDADFTWSAEVLAAQGRRLDQVSLEEIDWLGRLRRGLEKTRRGFVTQLLERLGDDPLSPEVLDDLETTLLRADVGVQATDLVLEALRRRLNEEVVDPAEGIRFLKEQLRSLLDQPIEACGRPLLAPEHDRLNVWLMVGVNGVGKTTTLGKLANLAVRSGYSCLIAAADTFRAAAVQQVSVWGERSGVPVIANPSANADPAAVVYDAIGAAKAQGTELVLVDTAGRLQTKHNLMEELAKVRRIVDKLAPEAVVESLLVLDASQGQNGLRQAMAFASAAGLTGVVITKLDGSARGGVALAVAHEAGLPIRFIGAGEGIRDLRPFNSFEFVEALLGA